MFFFVGVDMYNEILVIIILFTIYNVIIIYN
jgi:hypothetical protein